jgi:hypothetical protein
MQSAQQLSYPRHVLIDVLSLLEQHGQPVDKGPYTG